MKTVKIIGVTLVSLLGFAMVAMCLYGMGGDIMNWIPPWLSKFIIGANFFVLGIIIAGIFALGVIKIKEFFKEG